MSIFPSGIKHGVRSLYFSRLVLKLESPVLWKHCSIHKVTHLVQCPIFSLHLFTMPFPNSCQTYSWLEVIISARALLYQNNGLCICSPESSSFPFWMTSTDYSYLVEWTYLLSHRCRAAVEFWLRHRQRKQAQQSAFVATSSLMSVWCIWALNWELSYFTETFHKRAINVLQVTVKASADTLSLFPAWTHRVWQQMLIAC